MVSMFMLENAIRFIRNVYNDHKEQLNVLLYLLFIFIIDIFLERKNFRGRKNK